MKFSKNQKDPVFDNRMSKINIMLYYYVTYGFFIIFTVFPSIYLIFIDSNDLTGLVVGFWVIGIASMIFSNFFLSNIPTRIKLTKNSLHLFYKSGNSEQLKWSNLTSFSFDDISDEYILTFNENNTKKRWRNSVRINNRIGDHIIKKKYLFNAPVLVKFENMSKSYRRLFMIVFMFFILIIIVFIYKIMEDINLEMIVSTLLLIYIEIFIFILIYKGKEQKRPPKEPKALWDPGSIRTPRAEQLRRLR